MALVSTVEKRSKSLKLPHEAYFNAISRMLFSFYEKMKTLFDFKVYKGWVLQISSIYDKKCALKYLPKSAVWIENQAKLPSMTQSAENSRTFFKKCKMLFDFNAFKLKLLFSCVYGKKWALKYFPKLAVWLKNSLKNSFKCPPSKY